MNKESIVSFTRHSRLRLWCLLLAFLLTSLTAGCSHQPWDIDTYIQNLERPERDEYRGGPVFLNNCMVVDKWIAPG